MQNKLIGAILLSAAGLMTVLGMVGAQIANAIVLGGFYAGNMTGIIPPSPQSATPHWLIILVSIALAIMGLYFPFKRGKTE